MASTSLTGRRLSMPEAFLTQNNPLTSPKLEAMKLEVPGELNLPEGHLDLDQLSFKEFKDYKDFKHSDEMRFSRKSKRKSQSLYESTPNGVLGAFTEEQKSPSPASRRMITKAMSCDIPSNSQRFSPIDLPNSFNLSISVDNQLSSKSELVSKPGNETAQSGSTAAQEQEGENEGELDFLLTSIPRHDSDHEREQKRRSSHESSNDSTHPFIKVFDEPFSFQGEFTSKPNLNNVFGENTFLDAFNHSHKQSNDKFQDGSKSLNSGQTQFNANTGFNPLNNIHSFGQLNQRPGSLGAFQSPPTTMNGLGVGSFPNLNGLSNFNSFQNQYDPLTGLQSMGMYARETDMEVKKRRSRVPSSVYRGVSRCGKDKKYQARIRVHGKVKYLGRFKNELDAAKCYDKHAVDYLGVNAQTNFPRSDVDKIELSGSKENTSDESGTDTPKFLELEVSSAVASN